MDDHDLNECEQALTSAVETGELVDRRTGDEGRDDPEGAAEWGSERTVRAEVLVQLLTSDPRPSGQRPRALRLQGARICGAFDLEALELLCPLTLEDCFFDEPVSFEEAYAPSIRLTACRVPTVNARALETRGQFSLDRLRASSVLLASARIGGVLSLEGAELTNKHGRVLDADGLQVGKGRGMNCVDPRTTGELRLLGAHVGGELAFSGAQLSNPDGRALVADRLDVDATVFCRQGFTAEGEIDLVNAHIGGNFDLSGAQLASATGKSLNAVGLRVDQNMLCLDGFSTDGEVTLLDAHIGRHLDLSGARSSETAVPSSTLDLDGVRAATLFLPAEPWGGTIDLSHARVGQLHDRSWGFASDQDQRPYRPRLAGCVYDSLGAGSDDPAARLDWIAHAQEGYLPQAYDQLAEVFRQAGHEEHARDVAIAKQRHRRQDLHPTARGWNYFLDWTVGYGYRTWRAIFGLLTVMAIGWAVFAWASWDHLQATKSEDQLPQFAPWLFSIDAVLPVVNLGQEGAWAATGAAQYWYAFSVLAGWILGTALIAALTSMLTRE